MLKEMFQADNNRFFSDFAHDVIISGKHYKGIFEIVTEQLLKQNLINESFEGVNQTVFKLLIPKSKNLNLNINDNITVDNEIYILKEIHHENDLLELILNEPKN